jgi:hypothetical protein
MLCGAHQVWDLAAGACVQTIDGAHDNVIMGLINWQVGDHGWDELMSGVYIVLTVSQLATQRPSSRRNPLAD